MQAVSIPMAVAGFAGRTVYLGDQDINPTKPIFVQVESCT